MTLAFNAALERALAEGDEWNSWRALNLAGDRLDELPPVRGQDALGAFRGADGGPSPGATGAALAHLVVMGAASSGPAVIAADWLEAMRTPAGAWLDSPTSLPGPATEPGGARVWATASAACGLLTVGRDPGPRALELLRTEADQEGRFTGGAYPTFAAAAVFWAAEGPRSETAEWALRWAREWVEEWWGPHELTVALTFWAAAGIPAEHPSIDHFADQLKAAAPPEGWASDLDLTLTALEVVRALEG